jgi:hypothetical protein
MPLPPPPGGDRLECPRNHRHAQLAGDPPRRGLVAQRADRRRRRAHEDQPGGGARLGERGVLGEEPVAGVDGVGAGRLGDGDEPVDDEVALGRGRGADRIGLVGHQHVERLAVGLGEHGDGRDPLLAAGADHADRDLPAVGDEDLRDGARGHRATRTMIPDPFIACP